ncbi:hypothetical protein BKA61DRAFT_686406 [Leptodontidium sp. MPI-SDFR-AT-0119]|nr:hypothetical protein BKA61DRAFT_686406 [Leptodontidium sp. MPI-SDFR-AT-0119]
MPRPTIINLITFYYPIGNTPAVRLTQDLPPEDDADILLLGCGDFRNILFTAYADSAPSKHMIVSAKSFVNANEDTRRLDFTCCDIEGAVIARNILAFTLLLDDVDGQQHSNIWQIYYHLYLDDKAIRLLQAQAKKLSRLAETLESWKNGEYGRTLIFCDEGTFAIVKNRWNEYAVTNRSKTEQTKYDTRFKVGIEDSARNGKHFLGWGTGMTSLRLVTPLCMDGVHDSPKAFDHFWKHGTTDRNPTKLPKDRRPNPTFASRGTDTFALHYGTDPQLGFPLATAYVPLTKNSPLATEGGIRTDSHRITDAARTHFLAWSKVFQKSAKNFTLRFFVGDATAFSHTLEHVASSGDVDDDYRSSGSSPVLFDVIDTSNLLDHLGSINVLVAVVPLLKRQATSTLYTESLVAREKSLKDLMDAILCGSFPTMSLLLGLVPIEYWTNTTAVSHTLQRRYSKRLASIPNSNQMNVPGRKLHFDPTDLAILIHRIYQAMFKHEDMMNTMFSLSVRTLRNNSYPLYHRGSFATFLKFLQGRVDTNWDKTMELVLDRIANDKTIMMGLNYFQDLCAHIYLLGIYNVPEFTTGCRPADAARFKTGLGSWNHLPSVVCITLEVPRAKLKVILDVPRNELGTPNVQCCVQADVGPYPPNAWQNIFADVHLNFGKLIAAGEPTDGDHKGLIHEDPLGWAGNCPLLVSFNVPTWVILRDPSKAIVNFGIQSTPQSSATFIHRLGLSMNIAVAKLMDNSSVHITKFHPQQAGYTSVTKLVPNFEHGNPNHDFKATMTANVDRICHPFWIHWAS